MNLLRSSSTGNMHHRRGFTLLLAVLISSVVLSVGLSILSVTLQEYLFSGTGRESEIAFYAADGGMECAAYWDSRANGGSFSFSNPAASVSCMGGSQTVTASGAGTTRTRTFQVEWGTGNDTLCAKVQVVKYQSSSDIVMASGRTCTANRTCTEIESRGYNTECANATSGNFRVVERALRAQS